MRTSLTALPAWNRTTLLAAIAIVSPVWGFRPWWAGQVDVPKLKDYAQCEGCALDATCPIWMPDQRSYAATARKTPEALHEILNSKKSLSRLRQAVIPGLSNGFGRMRDVARGRLGAQETRSRAHAIPPSYQLIVRREKTGALGSQAENCDHRGRVKIGQAQRWPGEPRSLTHQLQQCGQAHLGFRQGISNTLLIACRSSDALDVDVPYEGSVSVAVEDADNLVHPRGYGRRPAGA